MDEISLFIFGSCHFSEKLNSKQSVGNGGYGVVICRNGTKVQELSAGYSNTTHARMDIMGLIAGVQQLDAPSKITCYLSSGYIVDTLSKGWLEKWKKTGFKDKKHADLWLKLDRLLHSHGHRLTAQHIETIGKVTEYHQAEQLAKYAANRPHLPEDLQPNSELSVSLESQKTQAVKTSKLTDQPILESICVDAATSGNPGFTEYRGVDTQTREVIFSMHYDEATNNIGEFLAIVHALALYKKQGKELKILYSDSLIAISWVKQKKCKTQYPKTEYNQKVFDHIDRAVKWLQNNEYGTKILKWNTAAWGQIPADYGRK